MQSVNHLSLTTTPLFSSLAGNHDTTDDAGQQQDTDSFERQYITIFVTTQQGVSDGVDVYLQWGKILGLQEIMLQCDKQDNCQSGNHRKEPCQEPAPF